MGLLRALNPFCTSATPPRKRTARAAEAAAREAIRQTALLEAHLAAQRACASAAVAAPAQPPARSNEPVADSDYVSIREAEQARLYAAARRSPARGRRS